MLRIFRMCLQMITVEYPYGELAFSCTHAFDPGVVEEYFSNY